MKKESEYSIIVKDVHKRFKLVYDKPFTLKERLLFWKNTKVGYHNVLQGINLKIKKGETVALIGVNGSGKSTLLKLMTKIYYPTTGKIDVNGKLTSLLELGAGFHQDFTGRENIYFNASIFGLNKKEIDEKLEKLKAIAEKKLNCTLAQMSIAWIIANPDISTVILGSTKISQVEEIIPAIDIYKKMTKDILKEIEGILENAPVGPWDYESFKLLRNRRNELLDVDYIRMPDFVK
jgi:ABC-type cobalamin/Fe3+-siderophores transport system ATPase subunit